jgi:outer membrane lipoprotein-sorting protein
MIISILRGEDMRRKNKIWQATAVLLLLCLTAGGAGCQGGGANEPPALTEAEITEKMLAAYGEIEDYRMTMHLTLHADTLEGESTIEMDSEICFKKPDRYREESIAGAMSGQITVTNGQIMWVYTPHINEVLVLDDIGAGVIITETGDLRDEMLSAAVRETELAAARAVKAIADVDGRPAYQLEITPRDDDYLYGDGPAQVWVDAADFLPRRVVSCDYDGRLVLEADFRDLRVNIGVGDEEFTFKTPPGATVVNVNDLPEENPGGNTSYQNYPDLAAAAAATGFDVLSPGYVPEGLARDSIVLENGAVLTLLYAGGEQFVALSQSREEIPLSYEYEKKTMIAAGEADTYREGAVTVLAWQEKGLHIALVGNIPENELVKVADSLN